MIGFSAGPCICSLANNSLLSRYTQAECTVQRAAVHFGTFVVFGHNQVNHQSQNNALRNKLDYLPNKSKIKAQVRLLQSSMNYANNCNDTRLLATSNNLIEMLLIWYGQL